MYLEQHALRITQNPFVRNSQNSKTLTDHISVTVLIMVPGFIPIVYFAIAFDYQTCFTTKEVCDVITELMLSPEFEAEQPAVSKQLPKQVFS
ncbi:MAG TPA: hypothetical protein VK557_00410 [Pyrinomonadaceae bacterium]|nr:hypothetical protein [Pyrinomonadaceae bacterium]